MKFNALVLFSHRGKIKDAYVFIKDKKCELKSNDFVRDYENGFLV